MVVLQILDQLLRLSDNIRMPKGFGIMRMIRILRLVRITRIIRVLHLFDELRTIVTSMSSSMGSLCWALILLVLMVYVFSVLVMQLIVTSIDIHEHDDIYYWFGSLGRSFLTMFECIVGGVGWDHVVQPLMREISDVMGVFFCAYIGIGFFAMMN